MIWWTIDGSYRQPSLQLILKHLHYLTKPPNTPLWLSPPYLLHPQPYAPASLLCFCRFTHCGHFKKIESRNTWLLCVCDLFLVTGFLVVYQFIIKLYNTGTARWKRCIGQGMWEGAQKFYALWACHSSWIFMCSPAQKHFSFSKVYIKCHTFSSKHSFSCISQMLKHCIFDLKVLRTFSYFFLCASSFPQLCSVCSAMSDYARILEWVAISYSRGSSLPRDQTCVSFIGKWILYH